MDRPSSTFLVPPSPSSKHLRARSPPPTLAPILTSVIGRPQSPPALPPRHPRRTRPFLRRYRLLVALLALFLVIIYLFDPFAPVVDALVLANFKLNHALYTSRWTLSCALRKQPLLFVHGDGEVAVVWESNCPIDTRLSWSVVGSASDIAKDARWTWTRRRTTDWREAEVTNVHKTSGYHVSYAHLTDLGGDSVYQYRISSVSSSFARIRTLATHTFTFASLSEEPTTLRMAALADNQFNVRTFHRLLRSVASTSPRPTLLLHAGDQVQNPHNLQQWDTDFWAPMTSRLPRALGQTTPIVLARGNHDWDATGVNAYTAGSPARHAWLTHSGRKGEGQRVHRGTYFSYSPHARLRILVLDSNLAEGEEQGEQEEWLEWEVRRPEWKDASLRLVLVHVAPFLEYWNRETWDKGESQWSIFVRHRIVPILSQHGASLVISGHSHAYARGLLPHTLARTYAAASNSSSLPSAALAIASERGWEKVPGGEKEPGTIYTIIGGAGGTLDEDRVEDWRFYEKSTKGLYHFVRLSVEFGAAPVDVKTGERRYRLERQKECLSTETLDILRWEAVGVDGRVFDRFHIDAEAC